MQIKKTTIKDHQLIEYQILKNNIMRIVWQKARRNINWILEVKGLNIAAPGL